LLVHNETRSTTFQRILYEDHAYAFSHAHDEQITTNKLDTRIQECSTINSTWLIYIYIATVKSNRISIAVVVN